MAPWISLALMVLAGLGLVLRHDMISVVGFDLGVASAVVGIIGLLMFSGRQGNDDDERACGFRDHADTPANYRQPLIVMSLAGLLCASYLAWDPALQLITGPRSTINKSAGAVQPEAPVPGRAALRLRRSASGTFNARSRVNGTAMTFRVDTGAVTIVLSADDARRLGIDPAVLDYSVPVKTAHGTSYAAPTRLSRVFVGPLGAADVQALVAKPGKLDVSLLGMSFLKRLRSYSVNGNYLTLEG